MSTDNGAANILSLSALISESVQTLVSEYTATGKLIPTLDSTDSGPFDDPEKIGPIVSKAIKTTEAACAQLTYTVCSPGHTVFNVSILLSSMPSAHISYIRKRFQ